MTIIAAGISTVANKDTINERNKQRIIDDFTELTVLTGNNNDIEGNINTKLLTFNNETYPQEHEEYQTALNEYQENFKLIKKHTEGVEENCKRDFEDSRVSIMCKSYQMLYEEATNNYIETITNYNNMIKKYNETAATPYSELEMIEKEYIDYNQDNVFLGKPEEDNVQ